MKKIALLLALLPLAGVKAQSFAKGQKDLNLGLGFGVPYGTGHYGFALPLSLSYDHGVTDAVSIGGYLGYANLTWRYTGSDWCKSGPNWVYYNYDDRVRWSFYLFGVRGAYHFAEFIKEDKVDLYLGGMLGFAYATYSYKTNEPCRNASVYGWTSYARPVWGAYLGCRYRFTDKIGVFGELGYGLSYLTLGVNFKL